MLSTQGLLQDLIRGKQAFCEQIICLYHKPEQRDWWHELLAGPYENERAKLFAPEGRITAASITEVADKAKEAVDAGYRPVFFVPDAAAWPPVYEAGPVSGFRAAVHLWAPQRRHAPAALLSLAGDHGDLRRRGAHRCARPRLREGARPTLENRSDRFHQGQNEYGQPPRAEV